MTPIFELMDLTTANVIGHFETEDEALAMIGDVIVTDGMPAIDDIALSRQQNGDQSVLIALGRDLAERAISHRHPERSRGICQS